MSLFRRLCLRSALQIQTQRQRPVGLDDVKSSVQQPAPARIFAAHNRNIVVVAGSQHRPIVVHLSLIHILLAAALSMLASKRDVRPSKKHGNLPL